MNQLRTLPAAFSHFWSIFPILYSIWEESEYYEWINQNKFIISQIECPICLLIVPFYASFLPFNHIFMAIFGRRCCQIWSFIISIYSFLIHSSDSSNESMPQLGCNQNGMDWCDGLKAVHVWVYYVAVIIMAKNVGLHPI